MAWVETVGTFSQLPDIFSNHNISTPDQLEQQLSRTTELDEHMFGSDSPGPEENILLRDIVTSLARITQGGAFSLEGSGISQFSTITSPRLPEADVRKALFLSRRATVFTTHNFRYITMEGFSAFSGDEWESWNWSLGHDYIRDLFTYREAIRNGALNLVPQVTEYEREGRSGTTQFSAMANATSVIDISGHRTLIDRLIEHYRANRQLVALPALAVPWIDNVNVSTILDIRDDSADELGSFQQSYHEALLHQIENRRSTDFAVLSQHINEDVIGPAVRRINRKYRRIVSLHRSLRIAGATVALLPVGSLLIAGHDFQDLLSTEFLRDLPAPLVNLIVALWTNATYRRSNYSGPCRVGDPGNRRLRALCGLTA